MLVKRIINYIDNNLAGDLSLDVIASKFYSSKYYLCHVFKESTNVSIKQFIVTKRVLKAASFIDSGMNVMDACYAVGFNNYSTFYLSFKKIKGYCPMHIKAGKD